MTPAAQLSAMIDLLRECEKAVREGYRTPADTSLAYFFKQRRYMGAKDKKHCGELFYYILRYKACLEWWAKQYSMTPNARILALLGYLFHYNAHPNNMASLCSGEKYAPSPLTERERGLLEACAQQSVQQEAMPEAVRYNIPAWMQPLLQACFGEARFALYDAMMQQAPTDIRANTLKTSRETLLATLRNAGLAAETIDALPHAIRLSKRDNLFGLEAFVNGHFEVQDAGSQILSELVQAKPGERVIDFCAGAGGKTLAIAAMMQNKGKILALDVHDKRLAQLPKRLKRAGVDNVELHHITSEQDKWLKRHKASADWVLVDAPCTGVGTWRRNPDLKWRTSEQDLAELVELQARILEAAAKLVKAGGHLVYATCSLLPQENQLQVEAFLQRHESFTSHAVNHPYVGASPYLQLAPHTHDTDGFFAAVLQKLA